MIHQRQRKIKETTKLGTSGGNSHSDTVAIDNLQKLLLNVTSEIADLKKEVNDESCGLNQTDIIKTEQRTQTSQMEEIAKLSDGRATIFR